MKKFGLIIALFSCMNFYAVKPTIQYTGDAAGDQPIHIDLVNSKTEKTEQRKVYAYASPVIIGGDFEQLIIRKPTFPMTVALYKRSQDPDKKERISRTAYDGLTDIIISLENEPGFIEIYSD